MSLNFQHTKNGTNPNFGCLVRPVSLTVCQIDNFPKTKFKWLPCELQCSMKYLADKFTSQATSNTPIHNLTSLRPVELYLKSHFFQW